MPGMILFLCYNKIDFVLGTFLLLWVKLGVHCIKPMLFSGCLAISLLHFHRKVRVVFLEVYVELLWTILMNLECSLNIKYINRGLMVPVLLRLHLMVWVFARTIKFMRFKKLFALVYVARSIHSGNSVHRVSGSQGFRFLVRDLWVHRDLVPSLFCLSVVHYVWGFTHMSNTLIRACW